MAIFNWREALIISLCITIHFIYRYQRKRLIPLPPGPSGWPLIGNALQMPFQRVYSFYEELGRKLGSKLLYVEVLGQSIVVVNDVNVANDLFVKRSALYSSRPKSIMVHEVAEINHYFGLKPYGNEWRYQRRIFQQHFSPKSLPRDEEKLLEFTRKFLLPSIYEDPRNFVKPVKSCTGAISLSLTYGLPVLRVDDPFIQSVAASFSRVGDAGSPGKYLVNIIPILKYLPEWMPGATFKRDARELRDMADRLKEVPFKKVLENMNNKAVPISFVAASLKRLRNRSGYKIHELYTMEAATQIFGAAYETTVTSVTSFVLAMLLYPRVQQKVQEEIDSLVGHERLPDYSDREHLPYLSAVLREVFRWNPVLPLGVPHLTTTDDVYKGYYIPKGSVVMANTHAMLHNEEEFPNPGQFIPERFMKDGHVNTDILDPFVVGTFGFGRRMCPGSHIARSTLYIMAVSMLSLFDIVPALDPEGKPICVEPKFTDSIFSMPLPFECKFTPRKGKNVESLLKEHMGVDVL